MKLATWNINSIRLRLKSVLYFVKKYNIDVLCLQETKVENDMFPITEFYNIGMKYNFYRGEKAYNGIAILSKIPFLKKNYINWCNLSDTRHISVCLKNNINIDNFYVPAGGDIPDLKTNLKFKHKIEFIEEMQNHFKYKIKKNNIIVGDLNIAPLENDVWSHKQLLNVVSHSPIEIEAFNKFVKNAKLIDIVRNKIPEEKKIYTWWSYRSKDWQKTNRGRRLDHILITKDLFKKVNNIEIFKNIRNWKKPSDHIPIILDIKM